MIQLVVLCRAVLAFALLAAGPVQAHQGAVEATEFRSPMVIDTIFVAADRSRWLSKGSSFDWFSADEYRVLGKYRCDGLSIRANDYANAGAWDSGLYFRPRELPDGMVEVEVWVSVLNPRKNHDKSVTVTLEVRNGDEVVTTATIGPWKVEDKGREKVRKGSLTVPSSQLKTDPMTSLRITLTARDI
ncbi:MAG: hypothetical protein HY049_15225 [Acidobacteria bacterium]|nr:hypothetical protein [Acidobacteriota bacterium]